MLFSSLERFATLVDMIMSADFLTDTERCDLITKHAYNYSSPFAIKDLNQAINECQRNNKG
jgi:hypothetical protein